MVRRTVCERVKGGSRTLTLRVEYQHLKLARLPFRHSDIKLVGAGSQRGEGPAPHR